MKIQYSFRRILLYKLPSYAHFPEVIVDLHLIWTLCCVWALQLSFSVSRYLLKMAELSTSMVSGGQESSSSVVWQPWDRYRGPVEYKIFLSQHDDYIFPDTKLELLRDGSNSCWDPGQDLEN